MAEDAATGKIHLDPDLVDNVARGSCVLFFGADHPLATPGPPTRGQLAAGLAERYPETVSPGQSLAEAAQQFLNEHPSDRHSLVSFLKDRVSPAPPWQYTAVHKAIVGLGFDAVVTAWYDDLMEQAYQDIGKKRVAQLVSGEDAAYTGGGEDVILVKLYGDVKQPDSLVIAEWDLLGVEGNLAQRLEDVRPFVRLRPILFVGWHPGDKGLARLYRAATKALGENTRRNFVIWPHPDKRDVGFWERVNVQVVDADPLQFLQALREAVQGRGLQRGQEAEPISHRVVGKLPYKALDFFDFQDQDIFCGREVEAPVLYRMALSYPLLTVFGQSGVGKTSLLLAGVAPRLADEKYQTAYVRVLGDPLLAVRQEVCRVVQAPGRERIGKTLFDFFREVLGESGRLIVMLDQAEELFTRGLSPITRREFWRELGACLGMERPEVRFVLSLREDFLPFLDEARRPAADGGPAPVPAILRNIYRLNRLEVDTARLAITEPAARANCQVEPLLADILLGRAVMPAATGGEGAAQDDGPAWMLVEADGTVPPPSLQIVMTRLYLDALARAGHAPPPEEPDPQYPWQPPPLQLAVEGYRALGGASSILAGYITQALDRLGEEKYPGDRRLAEALLKALVTTKETKAALDEGELLEELARAEAAFDPGVELEALRATRGSLVNLRLLRSFQAGDRAMVELAHDHMAKEIATWIGEEEMQAKLARELLNQQVESWQRHHLLIAPEALRLIHEQREALRRLSAAELELLLRSALAVGAEAPYWFGRAREAGVPVDAIARERLGSDRFRERAAAVRALAELGEAFAKDIIRMLGDDYPQVRAAAIQALERLQPDGAWRPHLKLECHVPAGDFTMGDDQGDSDEKPAHRVYLDAFYIGKYPVTNADYRRYRQDVGQPFEMPPGKEDHPVVSVSWYDARDYAAWAGMPLLTEAEWEKAASWELEDKKAGRPNLLQRVLGQPATAGAGGKKRTYPWGDTFDKGKCNTSESGIGTTTSVGAYSEKGGDSPYGVADMAGNVWEWTSSLYKEYKYDPKDGREDMTETGSRVLRGGSFIYYERNARCASRLNLHPYNRRGNLGFRVGVSPGL